MTEEKTSYRANMNSKYEFVHILATTIIESTSNEHAYLQRIFISDRA